MIAIPLVCAVLAGAATPALSATEQKTYDEATIKAGKNADAQVKLALWCEARGWDAGRLKHLALAALIDPKNAAARGLMGFVAYRGQWTTPEKLSAKVKADEVLMAKLAEYNARRAKLDEMSDRDRQQFRALEERGRRQEARAIKQRLDRRLAPEHVKLAMWCEQAGLDAEAKAHLTTAVVLDPYRDATWKHLGYIKHNGRWMTKAQIDAEGRDAREQAAADRIWDPLLKKLKGWLADPERRPEALDQLDEVRDVRAVPAIERTFLDTKEDDQAVAVRLFDRIDSPASTRDLAEIAVKGTSESVRQSAIRALREREKRDYAGLLVEMIRSPMRYQVQPVQGPGTTGALLVETPRFKVLRTYDAPPAFLLSNQFYGYVGYDANGLPVVVRGKELARMRTESGSAQALDMAAIEARTAQILGVGQLKAAAAQQQLVADVTDIETANAQASADNERVRGVLHDALDAPDYKDDEDAWHSWWYDQLGYAYQAPAQVNLVQNAVIQSAGPVIQSCFIAGTPVRTIDGRRPIDSLHAGDRVLCQDAATGALSFEVILVVHHNAPSKTVRIRLDTGETLVPSIYHRFWRAGRGWAQARDLQTGDVLRTLGGRARIEAVEEGDKLPVYNLDVAGGRTFFVGQVDALVHDNTLPEAHLKPFDAEPPLAAAAGEHTHYRSPARATRRASWNPSCQPSS